MDPGVRRDDGEEMTANPTGGTSALGKGARRQPLGIGST